LEISQHGPLVQLGRQLLQEQSEQRLEPELREQQQALGHKLVVGGRQLVRDF